MNRQGLTHKQRIEANELHDSDPDAFDIWLLNYMNDISLDSNMTLSDFIYEYYIEMTRINKINSLLDDE